jgi:hypothetical protein
MARDLEGMSLRPESIGEFDGLLPRVTSYESGVISSSHLPSLQRVALVSGCDSLAFRSASRKPATS